MLHAQEKDYAEAFVALREVLHGNPGHYAANHLLGQVALASGERLDEGAAALRRCLELEPAETEDGPVGASNVSLTPGRSIAVDPRVIPLGAPVYLATTMPNSPIPLERLVLAQDTGGAIRGVVRADFFWGFGSRAGQYAGRMRQQGRMWLLWPKGAVPG